MSTTAESTALAAAVERFRGLDIWVIGDLMLDEYVIGDVKRISPEAPIPVLRVREVQHRLGGAANVARQIATLGATARLFGVIGSDMAGDALLDECGRTGVDTQGVLRLASFATTRKLRALGMRQQLLRIDWEDDWVCPQEIADLILYELRSCPAPKGIILSDYAKGLLTVSLIQEVLGIARSIHVPVLVDPKRPQFRAYAGATVVTPNLGELEVAVGRALDPADEEGIARAAREIVEVAGSAMSLVVTRGERGMLVTSPESHYVAIPAERRAVFDVTGAGDTAIAVLALGMGSAASLVDSARIANVAAGLAVTQVGAAAVSSASICQALRGQRSNKLLSCQELVAKVNDWRLAGKRIVFTNGCFDLLHAGHLALLHAAAAHGDALVLAINSDESVRRLKGPDRPLVPEQERAALLAALECVDAVTIFDEDTPIETLQAIRPDVLVKGQDYRLDQVVGRDAVEAAGGRVELVPLLPARSTTTLLERIRRTRP